MRLISFLAVALIFAVGLALMSSFTGSATAWTKGGTLSRGDTTVVTLSTSPDIQTIEAGWRAWMGQAGVARSTIAIGQAGDILHTADAGRNAAQGYPMASLSKAVTAICLHTLLPQTDYDWTSSLGDMASELAQIGPAPDAGVSTITLTELATHTSGYPRNIHDHDTIGGNSYTQTAFARAALTDPGLTVSRGALLYSNVGYAVLGHVIEALTQAPYSDYCDAAVLDPAGANGATVAGRMWATKGFGGWQMSVQDYARFVMHWFGPDRPWVQDKVGPVSEAGPYRLGIEHHPTSDGYFIVHTGKWNSDYPARRHGSLFVTSHTGAVVVVSWQGTVPDEVYLDLLTMIATQIR